MRLEKSEHGLTIWQTGRQKNKIEYDNSKELNVYSRHSLATYERFLRANDEANEAKRIADYLGKIIRMDDIPHLIHTESAYRVNVFLNKLSETIKDYSHDYGLDLDPDFQRGHVWSDKQRLNFVEFVLKGGIVNPIYFNQTNWYKSDGEMVIVDGKQRLTSLLMFLNDEFPVFKDLDPEGVGYLASEFDIVFQNVVLVINNLPTRKDVLQWYLEMNRGNIAHTEDELKKVEILLENIKDEVNE